MDPAAWREQVATEVEDGARPTLQYFLLLALSCVLATLGLITNSVAVIIGAMLVAPLMGPIMGLALASIRAQRSGYAPPLWALVTGVPSAVILSALVAAASRQLPFDALAEIPPEVSARAHPSFFDLGVALAGGTAGAYAMARLKGAAAVIGVAIATALMPPLCSAGIGLAVADWDIARGALLLFLTNFVAIAFAALVVFAAFGFGSRGVRVEALQAALIATALVLLGGFLAVLTVRTAQDAQNEAEVRSAVNRSLQAIFPGAELLSYSRESSGDTIRLHLRVQVPGSATEADVRALQQSIASELNRSVQLAFVGVPTLILEAVAPGATATPTASATPTKEPTPTSTPTQAPTPTSTPQPPRPTAEPTAPGTGTGLS